MFFLQVGIFMVLVGMVYQDLKYRGIYWWMFPILLLLLAISTVQVVSFAAMLAQVIKSCLFLGFQFLALTAYISIRQKKLTNVFDGYFGLGDLLFLFAISFGFSFLNYVLFYLSSLMMVVFFTAIFGRHTTSHGKKIPLAGYQALLFILLMGLSWCMPVVNLLSDDYLINLLSYGS